MGRSESTGATSPNSDLNGAPNRRRAVGELSSAISLRTWRAISSRLRSGIGQQNHTPRGWNRGIQTVFLLSGQDLARGASGTGALGGRRAVDRRPMEVSVGDGSFVLEAVDPLLQRHPARRCRMGSGGTLQGPSGEREAIPVC